MILSAILLVGVVCLVQADVDNTNLNLGRFGLRTVHNLNPVTKVDYQRESNVAGKLKKILANRKSPAKPSAENIGSQTIEVASKPAEVAPVETSKDSCNYCAQAYLDPEEAKINFAVTGEEAKNICQYCGNKHKH